MLVVRAVEDQPDHGVKKGEEFRLYIVDAHHHMGREKSHRNTPAGAYDFYASLWFEIQKQTQVLMEEDSLLFEPVSIEAPTLASRIFQSRDSWERLNHGWLVDRTVVFPYTDDYSSPEEPGAASFKVSNDKIASWTTRAPHSARLVGFARVNPLDRGNTAVKELERSVNSLGLRGLKLHPLAQLFIDSIEEDASRNVVKRAGELGIPIIFDTRNIKTVVKIKRLVDSMRNDPLCGDSLKGLKIILAHCGMSPGDSRLFEAMKDSTIFAETSTLHDRDVPVLFETASGRLRTWSEKLLFGTDFSFLSVQALDIIMYMLSRDFPGSLGDTQRVLAGNALSLLRSPFRTSSGKTGTPHEYLIRDNSLSIQRELENGLIGLLSKGQWNIGSLDPMIPPLGTWPEPSSIKNGGTNGVDQESFVLTMMSKDKTRELHLWIRRRPGNLLSCTVLPTQGMIQLDTLENASQKLGSVLLRSVADHSMTLDSAVDMQSHVLQHLS
ncbi:MAG: amidohydrolase family protein [Candidatus Thorarchaeota archaeon]|jgi:predicted TIM-barrel fold metal-dependent hydrolase